MVKVKAATCSGFNTNGTACKNKAKDGLCFRHYMFSAKIKPMKQTRLFTIKDLRKIENKK